MEHSQNPQPSPEIPQDYLRGFVAGKLGTRSRLVGVDRLTALTLEARVAIEATR